jgi:hypothetical protein
MREIQNYLEGRLFKKITKLRLFNFEGIELFEEDLRFLKGN